MPLLLLPLMWRHKNTEGTLYVEKGCIKLRSLKPVDFETDMNKLNWNPVFLTVALLMNFNGNFSICTHAHFNIKLASSNKNHHEIK